MSERISISSLMLVVIVVGLIGVVIPIVRGSTGGCGCNGACIAVLFMPIGIVLFLLVVSISIKPSSWESSSLEASPSSMEVTGEVVDVVEVSSSIEVVDEATASTASILWVVGTVLPQVSSTVCAAWLIAFLLKSLSFGVLYFLNFVFGSFFVTVFPVDHLLLLLHEVLYFFLRCLFWIVSVQGEL